MKRSESAFLKWFEAQFGKRENGSLSDEALQIQVRDGKNAQRILNERGNWDKHYRAALYAWTQQDRRLRPAKKKGARKK